VRIYTTKGLSQHGQFALKYACDVLDYFATIFGVDYPLSKCDHVVVPEFVSGAMENWGLLVYRTTKILFDEQKSDNRLRLKAAYVVAHELAHQWFGNLVTMNWWNEVWLNEGFATWAGYLAVDHFFPGKIESGHSKC
jgi:aminopeptidase N